MNFIKYLIPVICVGLLHSCSDDDETGLTGTQAGITKISLPQDHISIFDINEELAFEFETANTIQIQEVSLATTNGKSIPTSINDNKIVFNSSSLLPFEFGEDMESTGTFSLLLSLTTNEGTTYDWPVTYSLNVLNPISVINGPSQIIFKDTTASNVIYRSFYDTFMIEESKIEALDVTWKNGKDGVETTLNEDFSLVTDTIDLTQRAYINDYNLTKGDTLIYTFTVTSGNLVSSDSIVLPIVPQPFMPLVESTLTSNDFSSQLSLANGETFGAGEKKGDIVFDPQLGFKSIVIEDYDSQIEFVQISVPSDKTSLEFFTEYNDIEQVKVDFDNGTASNDIDVTVGDVYVYKIPRKDNQEFYGILLVNQVSAVSVDPETINTEISILSKENSIIE